MLREILHHSLSSSLGTGRLLPVTGLIFSLHKFWNSPNVMSAIFSALVTRVRRMLPSEGGGDSCKRKIPLLLMVTRLQREFCI